MMSDFEKDLPIDIISEQEETDTKEIEQVLSRKQSVEKEEDPAFNTFFKNQSSLRVHKFLEEKTIVKKQTLVTNGKTEVKKVEEPRKKRNLQTIEH